MLWGAALVIIGWVTVFLMVTELIPTSYTLSLLAYGVFLIGFTVGMIAAFAHARMERSLREREGFPENQWDPKQNREH